jgi:hypothetical protein
MKKQINRKDLNFAKKQLKPIHRTTIHGKDIEITIFSMPRLAQLLGCTREHAYIIKAKYTK